MYLLSNAEVLAVMAKAHPDGEEAAASVVRRRLPAPQRRVQILAVAGDLFSREGIDESSMRKIASKAGVSPAVLYRHFADKDALLFALTESFFERLSAAMQEAFATADGPVARMRALMRTYLTFGFDNPHEYRLTFMTALPRLKRDADMKAFRQRARSGAVIEPQELTLGMHCFGMLERGISDLVAAGHTRQSNPAALTEAIWASGHGLVSLVITHDEFGWTERDALVDTAIDVMLNGLLWHT